MKLFAKEPVPDEPAPARAPDLPMIASEADLLRALDYEHARASRYGRPLSVLRIVPQVLPNEVLSPAEVEAIGSCVKGQLRDVDHVGILNDGSFAAVLPETEQHSARVVALRLASELTLRGGAVRQRKWLVGAAELWAECDSPEALLAAAAANTIRERGRAAA